MPTEPTAPRSMVQSLVRHEVRETTGAVALRLNVDLDLAGRCVALLSRILELPTRRDKYVPSWHWETTEALAIGFGSDFFPGRPQLHDEEVQLLIKHDLVKKMNSAVGDHYSLRILPHQKDRCETLICDYLERIKRS